MQQYDEEAIDKMRKKVKKYLDKDRYIHTLGVMYTAGALAMRWGADLDQALIAGLLHDCAKCIPNDKKIRMCRKNGITVSPAEEANPSLLHAKLGAYLAAKKYHIRDRGHSVCHHLPHDGKAPDEPAGQDPLHCGLQRAEPGATA